jgi:outer membrane protein OmpA-like peptidoglycan-associated protein
VFLENRFCSWYYNKKLSELRANTAKSYLAAKGISPSRIKVFGFGSGHPLKPNSTAAGRWTNRRVEIELLP